MLYLEGTDVCVCLCFPAEEEDGTPVTLESGFMFDVKEDAEATWAAVLQRVDAQLRREGFKGKRVAVWGTKVRPNLRRRCCLPSNSPGLKRSL